jgi:oxaloacetate decarboxylase beta subunit
LVPIAFGGLLSNIPVAGIAEPGGFLNIIYEAGIHQGLFPLMIFMGVGAMTDFGPLIANPKTALLGGAAQFGIFGALLLALCVLGLPLSKQVRLVLSVGLMVLHQFLLQQNSPPNFWVQLL